MTTGAGEAILAHEADATCEGKPSDEKEVTWICGGGATSVLEEIPPNVVYVGEKYELLYYLTHYFFGFFHLLQLNIILNNTQVRTERPESLRPVVLPLKEIHKQRKAKGQPQGYLYVLSNTNRHVTITFQASSLTHWTRSRIFLPCRFDRLPRSELSLSGLTCDILREFGSSCRAGTQGPTSRPGTHVLTETPEA